MKVFKFGGASVRDASAFKNVLRILLKHSVEPTVVVLSAMGKTTNALERLVSALFEKAPGLPKHHSRNKEKSRRGCGPTLCRFHGNKGYD